MSDDTPRAGDFYITGGTLPLAAESYVVRQADTQLFDGLHRGEFCYVLDTRQMGKSSLMVRTARRLKEEGRRVVVLDLTALGQNLSVEQWYAGLLGRTAAQTGQMAELLAFWKEHRDLGPMQRFLEALRQVLLTPPPGADSVADLILFVDEIDAVRSLPFSADEFFAGIRECYNRRPQDPEFARLTFCLLGVAAPTDLVRDTRLSPFNIGRRIELRDFTPAEAEPLAGGLVRGGAGRALRLLRRILFWTGGHPYMTQRLCRGVAEKQESSPPSPQADNALVDGLCRALFLARAAQETDDNLAFVRNRLLHSESDVGTVLEFYLAIRRGRRVRDDAANPLCSLLRLSGVVVPGGQWLTVRNRIYCAVFDAAWVLSSLPAAEVRRQQQAYRRGVLRTGVLALCIIAVIVFLAASSMQNARQARSKSRLAETQTSRANEKAALADENAALAKKNSDLVHEGLSRSYVEAGTRLLDADDAGAALAPFAAAMVLDAGNAARMAQHRRRFAAALTLTPRLERLWSVGGPLRWASFSPDKTQVAAAGEDGHAYIWEVATGTALRLVMTHAGGVTDAAFSPDGTRLATCGEDDRARVWDLRARRLLWTLGPLNPAAEESLAETDGRLEMSRLAWSHDGGRLAAVRGSTLTVWNVSGSGGTGQPAPVILPHDEGFGASWSGVAFAPDGKAVAVIARNYIGLQISVPGNSTVSPIGSHARGNCYVAYSVAYSRDGRRLLVAGKFGGHSERLGACVFSAASPDTHAAPGPLPLLSHRSEGLYAAFSPDETRIATASEDGTACVWDAATGTRIARLQHARPVVHVEFSPDGRRVVTASQDGTARVWDAATGAPACAPLHHAGSLVTAQFGADDSHVLTAGRDGTVRLWALPSPVPEPVLRVKPEASYFGGTKLLSGGTRLAVLTDRLRLYDLATVRLLSSSPVFQALFWADENWTGREVRDRILLRDHAASPTDGGRTFQVWDARRGTPLSPPLRVAQAFLSPDEKTLAWETKGLVHLTDPVTGRPSLPPLRGEMGGRGYPFSQRGYPFAPNGRTLALGDGPASVRLLERRTGRVLSPPIPGQYWRFSPNSRYLFTWTERKELRAWNAADGTPASTKIAVPRWGVDTELGFSRDGRYAVSAGQGCSWFWRLDGSRSLRPQRLSVTPANQFVFSADGTAFAALGPKTWLWRTGALTPVRLSVDYGVAVTQALFSPDSRRVLTVLTDGTAAIWDVQTGRQVTPPLPQNVITTAAFSADGTMAATADAEGGVRVWDTETGEALTATLPATPPVKTLAFAGGRLVVESGAEVTVYPLPMTSESLPRLLARARLLSGQGMGAGVGPAPAAPATLRADWALVGAGH